MLTILSGPARSGKTHRVLELIAQSGQDGLVLLTPEQGSHEAERALAAFCGPRINLRAEVLSFTRLASRVFTELGGAADVLPDKGARLLLMSLALSSAAPRLRLYGSRRRRAELLEGLLQAREELSHALISPARLGELAASAEGELGKKLGDLSLICEAYDALLAARLPDSRERLDRLAELMEQSRVGRGGMFFDGFTDFTPQELNVFDALLRRGGDLTVTLCRDGSESEHFAVANATYRRLLAMAERRGVPVRTEELRYEDESRDPALALYCENLFNYKRFDPPETPCACLEAAEADGVLAECEIAAGRILRAMKEDPSLRWADFAVAARSFSAYESLAESVFALYGIPVFIDRPEELSHKGVFALTHAALDAAGSWRQEDIFRCLKTGLAGLTPDETGLLENYCVTWDLRGEAAWKREWTMNPRGYVGEDSLGDRARLEELNALRERVAAPLSALSAALRTGETAEDFSRALWRYYEALGLLERLPQKAAALRADGREDEAATLLRSWELLCGAIDQFTATLSDAPLSWEEAARLFLLLLSGASAGRIPTALDAVSLGELTRLRGRRVRRLILLGAAQEDLPKLSESGGVFSQWERQRLTELGLALEQVPDEALCREFSDLYLSFSAASEALCLLWPADKTPAFPVSRTEAILGVKPVSGALLRRQAALEAEEPLFRLALADEGGPETAAARALAREQLPERWSRAMAAADPERGRLSPAAVEALYGHTLRLTASKAEKFSVCRFAYFLRYGLGARPRPRSGIEAPEFGTFVHYVLEHTARAAREAGGFAALGLDGCREAAEKAVENYIETDMKGFAGKSPRFIYLFRRLREQVLSIVEDVAEEFAASDFAPMDFELDFSRGGDLPPVELESEGIRLCLEGKVDRVDGWVREGKLYLRVADYKTGKTKFDLTDVWYGKGIQMLIYLFALEAEGQSRYNMPVVPAGVLYTPARDPALSLPRGSTPEQIAAERRKTLKRTGLLLDDPEVLEAMEKSDSPVFIPVSFKDGLPGGSVASQERLGRLAGHVRRTLRAMGRELSAGSIEADPLRSGSEDPCAYCDYVTACDFREGKDRERVKQHLSAKQFWERLESAAE